MFTGMPFKASGDGSTANFQTIILPGRVSFDWRLCQLRRYRDVIGPFVRRDFVAL